MKIQHTTQNLNSCKSIQNGNKINANNAQKDVSFNGGFYNSPGLKKFLTSEKLGKLLDLSANNPVVVTSLYSLFLCTLLRPATIMALPGKNVDDKKYASAHSIASGVMGFLTTAAILTPIAGMVKKTFRHPGKFLKSDMVKKLYPNVKTVESKNPKTLGLEKVKVTKGGKLIQSEEYAKMREEEIAYLKESGTWEKLSEDQRKGLENPLLCMTNEPIIHEGGPLRSFKYKKANGEACALQKNGTPVVEDLKVSESKNSNVNKLLTMVPDLMIAFPRASITVATIPPILAGVFGLKKSSAKNNKQEETKPVTFEAKNEEQNNVAQSNNQQKIDYTLLFPGLKKEVQ